MEISNRITAAEMRKCTDDTNTKDLLEELITIYGKIRANVKPGSITLGHKISREAIEILREDGYIVKGHVDGKGCHSNGAEFSTTIEW